MTASPLTRRLPLTEQLNADTPGGVFGFLLRSLKPDQGWVALALLCLNLMAVVLAVEQADWVPAPNLIGILLMAVLAAFLLYRLPVWPGLPFLAGLALGLVVVTWQMLVYPVDGEPLGSLGELWARLDLWFEAARSGSINIDQVPFAFGLLSATWLTGFVGAWLFLRMHNFWGVFVLGGIGLFSNLTFLPPNIGFHLGVYLFTALLLVARIQVVRRQDHWRERNVTYDTHLGSLTFSDSFFLGAAVIVIAFLLPVSGGWTPATNAYESMRSPLASWEDDFNRLFAGLPARRPLGYRIWDDVMAFQGTINPATTPALVVESEVPMYWKARTYGAYTGKGWISEGTEFQPLGYSPEFSAPHEKQERFEATYTVTPLYDSGRMFSGDRVVGSDQEVEIETLAPPVYEIDLSREDLLPGFPPALARTSRALHAAVVENNGANADTALASLLPSNLRLQDVRREDGRVVGAVLIEALPSPADVLSVRKPGGEFESSQPYKVSSLISLARPEDLRSADGEYPIYVLDRYTRLPATVPDRVHRLARDMTSGEVTSYDKAKAIEHYLKTIPYNLSIEPPPFDADGVDHFLFDQKQGYSEYFASAMAVLLRSVGVPARVAAGYTLGDELEPGVFAVTDSHSHAWVEVYFPGYSWIAFEPTPGEELPSVYEPGRADAVGSDFMAPEGATGQFTCLADFLEGCDELEAGPPGDLDVGPGSGIVNSLLGIWPWVVGIAVGLIAIVLAVLWFWKRYLAASPVPQEAFSRLSMLGRLAAVGPRPHQTPYQFGARLAAALPGCQPQLHIVTDTYVRFRYGGRTLSDQEEDRLTGAWTSLRYPLLRLVIFRRGT